VTQLEAARGGPGHERHIDAAVALARRSLSEARRSVHALRPQALEGARLPDAIAQVAREWAALHRAPVEVMVTGEARLMRPDVDVVLLRAAQEALANVAKYACASRVGVTLSYMDDVVTLDVRDDGIGFAANGTSGYGLLAMRQRLAGLSGTLAIESEPGAGTALSATAPAAPA
jgi:signal transduction histidine kinase